MGEAMPLYDYYCKHCEREEERFHLLSEDLTGSECTFCGTPGIERVIAVISKEPILRSSAKDRVKEFISQSSKDLEIQKMNTRRDRGVQID